MRSRIMAIKPEEIARDQREVLAQATIVQARALEAIRDELAEIRKILAEIALAATTLANRPPIVGH